MSAQTPSGFGSGAEPGSGSGSGAINDPSTKTTTTTANDPAAGSPQSLAAFQPPSGEPNPFTDTTPWGRVVVGGFLLPGIIESIDGCGTPEEWTDQKGTSGNFATKVWKGSKLASGPKIKMQLYDRNGFAKIYRVRNTLRPTRGKKPPSLSIVNPIINFGGITRIVCNDVGFPKWVKSGGYWEYEIDLAEYNPAADAKTGPADPSKPADGSTPGTAQGAEQKYVLGQVKNP